MLTGILAVGLLSSCTIAKIGGRGAVPIMLNQPSQNMDLAEHVTIKKNCNFDWTNTYDVSEYLSKEVAAKKPDAVANTTVVIKTGIDNYFINLFTLGFAQSKKVIIEADFMKNKTTAIQTSTKE